LSNHESSKTVGELLLELAVRVGLASQGTTTTTPLSLPTDPATLQILRRALDAGIARVARFRSWSWLRPTLQVTCDPTGQSPDCVKANPGDYWLDRLAARIVSKQLIVRFADGGGGNIAVVSEQMLETARARNAGRTGRPTHAAFAAVRPTNDGDRVRDRMVLKLWPTPDAAHVVSFSVKRDVPTLVELTERPFWPQSVDEAVLACAVEHMARYGSTVTELSLQEASRQSVEVLQELAAEDKKANATVLAEQGGDGAATYAGTTIVDEDGSIITG
jgi:hypothetical protein